MRYIIQGGRPLRGTITVSGSKNAALPIIAATLLTDQKCVLQNVPDIDDVNTLLSIMKYIGSEYTFKNNHLEIQTKKIKNAKIPHEMVSKLRGSIVLLGPLIARCNAVEMGFPGGCILGKRPIDTHLDGFQKMGATVYASSSVIRMTKDTLEGADIVLKEISVTATENIVAAATLASGTTIVRLAACEPHVQDLCRFLNTCGAKISGMGTHTITIEGVQKLSGASHKVVSDYLEVGTFAIAAAATEGDITIHDANRHDLDILWQKLQEAGVHVSFNNNEVRVVGPKRIQSIRKIDTGVFPKFPTDLQAPFMVLMCKAEGVSKVFETLFEGRLNYLFELERMGAHIEFLNPHQAIVIGPAELKAKEITSCDIRAGAAMIVAALMAQGQTVITNINYIERGYENIHKKLTKLGASIQRYNEEIVTRPRTITADVNLQ